MKILEYAFVAVFGAFVSIPIVIWVQTPSEAAVRKRMEEAHEPQRMLAEANGYRRMLTERDFDNAQYEYKLLIRRPDTDRKIKAQAYLGLSRTYSERAIVRFWRGISQGELCKSAEDYALSVEADVAGHFDV
ncbi:MAG TPA: hypothetical protein VI685_20050, partial [Candidatus Angelobacter sp.]